MERSISPYKSLNEISAVDFHKIKYLGELELMDKNKRKHSKRQLKVLNKYWLKLNDEYFKLIKDGKGKMQLRNETARLSLTFKINLLEQVINAITFAVLNKNSVPLNALNGFITQISSSVKKISSGLSKKDKEDVYDWIERLRNYRNGLITRQERQEVKEVKKAEFSDFYKEKAYLEMALEKNHISEDVKMTEWVVYKNQAFIKLQKNGK